MRRVSDGPEAPPHKSRKDTRRWCKGKVGREHTPKVQRMAERNGWRDKPCGKWPWGLNKDRWWCHHEEVCTTCGKVLRWTLGDSCPDKP